jgi:two-component system CAI-1 autoinducer sensor kinase/phosphatase CqsS
MIEVLNSACVRSFEYSERHLKTIAIVCLTLLPLSTFVERLVANPAFDTLPVRVSAALVGGGLLFHKKRYTHFYLYWIFAISYILPFCFALMLVLNAAFTPEGETFSSIWIYEYLVALFFFVSIVHHGLLSTVLWAIATILSATALLLVPAPNWESVIEAALLPLPVFLTAVVIGNLMNRNVAMVQTEKLRAASAIGANLAHELRTPLASISTISKGVVNLLPALTDAYEKATKHGIEVDVVRDSQLKALKNALDSIRNEVKYSNTIIDMLLMNTAEKPILDVDQESFTAAQVISEAIDRYPFNNSKEAELLHTDTSQDFLLTAPRLLVIHVLFNLIKNSLFFVQRKGDGEIWIGALVSENEGRIFVKDTGAGIPPSIQPHIFERFYTTTTTGQSAGIGLSFCKLVMESIGGKISCESKEGEYTTFTLTFPNIRVETPSPHSGSTLQTPLAD